MLSEVCGQDEGVRYLQKVVDQGACSPLLLVGDEGVGRRFSVIAAAREVIAKAKGVSSPEYLQVVKGIHPDVVVVTTPGEKEIGVDAIRSMLAQAITHPTSGPCKFFILDGADRMTVPAANALLKTLEEPPVTSLFFLLAESYERVLPTIRSRCGRVVYGRLPESFVAEKLRGFEQDDDKVLLYSRMGEGSVGRATRYWGSNRILLRDQVLDVVRASANGDLSSAFATVDDLDKELSFALRLLNFLVHDVLVIDTDPDRLINQDISEDISAMRRRTTDEKWLRLWHELKLVLVAHESSYVNVAFHLKTALASAFLGS